MGYIGVYGVLVMYGVYGLLVMYGVRWGIWGTCDGIITSTITRSQAMGSCDAQWALVITLASQDPIAITRVMTRAHWASQDPIAIVMTRAHWVL